MSSSGGKQLQCGHAYDKVTPPCPAGAIIRLRKSVHFSVMSSDDPLLSASVSQDFAAHDGQADPARKKVGRLGVISENPAKPRGRS